MSDAGPPLPIRHRVLALLNVGYDRLVASDPGMARLRFACGVLSSVALAALTLVLTGFPPTAVLLGASLAMMASSAPVLSTPRKQAASLALTILPAAVSLTASSLLAPYRVVSDLVFLVVIFLAVYVRRIADYGFALGFPAFMMFFFASFVRATPAQLPTLLVAVAIGLVAAGVVRLVLLRPRSTRTLPRVRRGFQARLVLVLDAATELLDDPGQRAEARLTRRTRQLHESALIVEAELDGPLAPDDATAWQRQVLAAELATERLASLARRGVAGGLTAEDRALAADRLRTLIAILRADRQRGAGEPVAMPDWASPGAARTAGAGPRLEGLLWTIGELADTLDRSRRGEMAGFSGDAPAEPAADPTPPPVRGLIGRMLPTTRQAVQATLACALALVAGELLSPQRWYWAVIAAFVVFAGTSSAGETLLKGMRRVAGTMVGIVAGTVVAIAVAGNIPLVVVLLFVCIFAGFYLIAISYSFMVFFITVMLGMLYSLLGTFSTGLLVIRLEETLAGAVAGGIAALIVLPTSTKAVLRGEIAGLLSRLADFVDATVGCLADGDLVDLVDAARDVDAEAEAIRRTADPILHLISPRRARRSDTRHLVTLLDRCAYDVRGIAAHAEVAALPANAELAAAGSRIAGNLRGLLPVLLADRPAEPLVAGESPVPVLDDGIDEGTRRVLEHLAHLDQAVLSVGRSIGADPESGALV